LASLPNIHNNTRVNFAKTALSIPYPDMLEIQLRSFQEFMQLETPPDRRKNEGLWKVFNENFPVKDARENFVLEFRDYTLDPPRYTIDECKERGLTYSVALKAKLYLYCTDPDNDDFEPVVQEVYLGNIPYMTPGGTFIINGAERVIVSQLHRSPGVFFGQSLHPNGTKLYSARIIPFKGSWIEFSTDVNNVMYAYIDGKKKFPITTLLRAIGYSSDKDILELFGLAQEVKANRAALKKAVGRRLAARVLKSWVEDFVDEETGEVISITRNEVLLERDHVLDEDDIETVLDSGEKAIILLAEESNTNEYAIILNTLQKDNSNSELEAVQLIYRQLRNAEAPDEETARGIIEKLFFSDKRYDLGEVGRYRLNKKLHPEGHPETSQVLTKLDIIRIVNYLIELVNSKANVDDIDHLSNRRVRTVGEQLYAQFSVGLARMSRTIRERMNIRDNELFTQLVLWHQPVEPVYGPNQPAGRNHPQAPHFGIGPRWPKPRARGLRGARRALQPLWPPVPHRNPRGPQYRPYFQPVRVCQGELDGLHRNPLLRGEGRHGEYEGNTVLKC
jgi:DNA-directed RNA polymerase subunit beta